jgi:hypothetical protein
MNCNCINNQIFATGLSIVNNQLVLSFNRVPAIADKGFFCFRFSENLTLPANYATLPLYANVTVNGTATTIPLYDKYGDIAVGSEIILNRAGGICTRYTYGMYTGVDSGTTGYHGLLRNIPKIIKHSI